MKRAFFQPVERLTVKHKKEQAMTEVLSHKPHMTIHPNSRQIRTRLREDADAILRDIAFVLKMTERVRAEIESKKPADKPA